MCCTELKDALNVAPEGLDINILALGNGLFKGGEWALLALTGEANAGQLTDKRGDIDCPIRVEE